MTSANGGGNVRSDDGPSSELDIATGAFLQYVESGDDCYICNLTPDEMRAFIRDLGDRDREHNASRPGTKGARVSSSTGKSAVSTDSTTAVACVAVCDSLSSEGLFRG